MDSSSILNSELHSTLHDRERRALRKIDKEEQLRARRYGMCEHNRDGKLKYTYSGMVLIWCPARNRAVTSWKLPGSQRGSSGTCKTEPVLIEKSFTHTSATALVAHYNATNRVRKSHDKWTSHTVLVVDMSGSMRMDDVDGARCRSDGVWTCLSRDFIEYQLREGKTSLYDVVSVILMRDTAEVIVECEPTDYVLYNKLVDLREWTNQRPSGHGNYGPALESAEMLLNINRSGSCALSLFFFSDGQPSDAKPCDLPAKMGSLASRFGRRLTVTCVGMANKYTEDFSILDKMVEEAKAYGAVASFNKPTMDTNSLSEIIFSQVTSLLTTAKTELTNLSSGKSMTVRTDLVRERADAPDDVAPTDNWTLYNSTSQYTNNVWTWNEELNKGRGGFSRLIDPRCASCFRVNVMKIRNGVGLANEKHGKLCTHCKACFHCWTCIKSGRAQDEHPLSKCLDLANQRRRGTLMSLKDTVPSFNVAWKKQCFGEGAERVAFKFCFLDESGCFLGTKMVAKESRFVNDQNDAEQYYLTTDQHKYHRAFMQTQFLASRFALEYNQTFDEWEDHLENIGQKHGFTPKILYHKEQLRKYPRIRFLQPHIFELARIENNEISYKNVLVEPMIQGPYRKYNTNNGGLAHNVQSGESNLNNPGFTQDVVNILLAPKVMEKARISLQNCTSGAQGTGGVGDVLSIISERESDDEETESDYNDSDSEVFYGGPCSTTEGERPVDLFEHIIIQEGEWGDRKLANKTIPDEDFMQAFSHFSYVCSGGKFIVVDLQGTLSIEKSGRREFVLTDPAVHKREQQNSRLLRGMKFGRTDRGNQGILDFFATHVCNDACQLLGLRERRNKLSIFKDQAKKDIWSHSTTKMDDKCWDETPQTPKMQ